MNEEFKRKKRHRKTTNGTKTQNQETEKAQAHLYYTGGVYRY